MPEKTRMRNFLKRLAKEEVLLKNHVMIWKDYLLTRRHYAISSNISDKGCIHYLPHRPVIRIDKDQK